MLADSIGIGIGVANPAFLDSLRFELAHDAMPVIDYQWNRQSNGNEFVFNRDHTGTRQNGTRDFTWGFVEVEVQTTDTGPPPPNPRFFVFDDFEETSDTTATLTGARVDNLIDKNVISAVTLLGTK